jgi:hypothetical protein
VGPGLEHLHVFDREGLVDLYMIAACARIVVLLRFQASIVHLLLPFSARRSTHRKYASR